MLVSGDVALSVASTQYVEVDDGLGEYVDEVLSTVPVHVLPEYHAYDIGSVPPIVNAVNVMLCPLSIVGADG